MILHLFVFIVYVILNLFPTCHAEPTSYVMLNSFQYLFLCHTEPTPRVMLNSFQHHFLCHAELVSCTSAVKAASRIYFSIPPSLIIIVFVLYNIDFTFCSTSTTNEIPFCDTFIKSIPYKIWNVSSYLNVVSIQKSCYFMKTIYYLSIMIILLSPYTEIISHHTEPTPRVMLNSFQHHFPVMLNLFQHLFLCHTEPTPRVMLNLFQHLNNKNIIFTFSYAFLPNQLQYHLNLAVL